MARSLHDLGLAAWFGSSLAGVIGVDSAAAAVPDKRERLRVANAGWARLGRFSAVAAGVHLVGAVGVLLGNKGRVLAQSGVGATTLAKAALTAAAAGATAYCAVLGPKVEKATGTPVEGSTEPAPETPEWVANTQRQLAVLEWAVPVLTGAVVVLNAVHGEQQRPSQVVPGILQKPAKLLGIAA